MRNFEIKRFSGVNEKTKKRLIIMAEASYVSLSPKGKLMILRIGVERKH